MLALGLCVLLLGGPDAPPPAKKPRLPVARVAPGDEVLREAKLLRYAQRYYEAAALYRRYLTEYPKKGRIPEARFWLAATLEQDRRWDEAASAYSEFLKLHPDQQLLGQEAKLNRVRCWGIRQGQSAEASPGLLGSLNDADLDVQVAAALELARVKDMRAIAALQKGLALSKYAEASGLALCSLGIKPDPSIQAQRTRFLVIRICEAGKADPVTVRLAIGLARALENYLSNEQIRKARARGVELDDITDRASKLPKGSVLFSVDDTKSSVTVTVE